MSKDFRRLALALLVPIVGLGTLAALNQAATAQVPENLKLVARQRLSQLYGLSLSALTVGNSAKAQYPLQGKTAFKFKVRNNESGAVYQISLNSSGQEVNAEQLLQQERIAYKAKFGKLDPWLAVKLASTPPEQLISVGLWLKTPPYTGPQRPDPDTPISLAQPKAFRAQVIAQRTTFVQPIVNGVVTKLKNLGFQVTSSEKSSPIVHAKLTPSAIRQIAKWGEVDEVYENFQLKPALEIARPTIRATEVPNLGITGTGVNVAQVEVGGRIAIDNPYLAATIQDPTYVCPTVSKHSTAVAGIIRSTDSLNRGIAPDVSLWAGGSCDGFMDEMENRSLAAADWGADVLNLSIGDDNGGVVDGFAKFYDDMVINRVITVVAAAGNAGTGTGNVTTPGVAYNAITVGNFDTNDTVSWLDDTTYPTSSWRNPYSESNDHQKPEVAAPGANIFSTTTEFPWTGFVTSGTSLSAPMVTGVAALLIQRNRNLAAFPESLKAILMTTAVHNIEGDTRLSEYDGAGGIVADRADEVARNTVGNTLPSAVSGQWAVKSYYCSVAPPLLDLGKQIPLTAGKRFRATLVWSNDPAYVDSSFRPSADLDLEVVNSLGIVVSKSESYDNTYEIVEYTPLLADNYKLRVRKSRCNVDPRYIGWAWYHGD